MHKYLKAVGFENIDTKKKLHNLLAEVEDEFTDYELLYAEDEMDYCEYQKEFAERMGVSVFGEMDLAENFYRQYYFPYFIGRNISSYADVAIEKRIDRDQYVGICDEARIGINLIFTVLNTIEYLKELKLHPNNIQYTSVTLSALCNRGVILLPVMKDEKQEKKQKEDVYNRMMLMDAAKSGDQVAIENLTLDDIDTYSKVAQRIIKEDIFSIVDTYMMPYGVECDRYSILGTILNINKTINKKTMEEIYVMKMEVNDLQFDLCIPAKRVIGEPQVGRRFKGNIWMQGMINF